MRRNNGGEVVKVSENEGRQSGGNKGRKHRGNEKGECIGIIEKEVEIKGKL